MPFIDAFEVEQLKEKLSTDASRLGKLYKAKKSEYHNRNVDHNSVEDYLRDGWEEFAKPLKTKTKLRKLKSHDHKFEDDIWCQLYELGFRNLNYGRDFALPYGKGEKERKQIDVIAVNEDSILLIECKSAKQVIKAPSFKTEFEGLPLRLGGFKKTLAQMFGKSRKVKYIFATRNIRLPRDSSDVKRLENTNSFFYNDNTFDYVNGLLKAYKNAAHYQFMAILFRGEYIKKGALEVPAIEGKMGGLTYYMFSVEPHLLLKLGFILHRTRANEAEMPTYQRLLVPSRLKGITKFIDNGGYFPNSIIVNFTKQANRLRFEPSVRGEDSKSRFGTLKIPNAYAIAYIIDGQHRVYAYANSAHKESNTVPVVAFNNLDSTDQLKIFMDINENQKAVSTTLRITLEEDLYWNADRVDSRLKALRSSVIQKLGGDIASSLYNKISIGEDKALLSANPFASALSRSELLPSAKGNSYVEGTGEKSLYNVNNNNHEEEMSRTRNSLVAFLNLCYGFVESDYPKIFERERYFIVSNRGTFAFISLIGSLNSFESIKGSITPVSKPEIRFAAIEKYLRALMRELQKLEKEEEERVLAQLGSGADVAWLRFFQNLVNKKYPDYEPAELVDWKERQDQELQDKGRRLGTNTEKFLKRTVITKLKELFGSNWELEIGSIQRACESRAKELMEKQYKEGLGGTKIPWTDMFYVMDYKKIIESYWSKRPKKEDKNFKSFEEIFSYDAGYGFNSKAEKLKWLSIFNSHRNSWAHEGTKEKGLNKEEVEFLERLDAHFVASN